MSSDRSPDYRNSFLKSLIPGLASGVFVAFLVAQGDVNRWSSLTECDESLLAGVLVGVVVVAIVSAVDHKIRKSRFYHRQETPTIQIRPDEIRYQTIVIQPEELEDYAMPAPTVSVAAIQQELDLARCPYCSEVLHNGSTLTECNACKTPHHTECWQANGGCTTFGCRHAPQH